MKLVGMNLTFDEKEAPGCHMWKANRGSTIYVSILNNKNVKHSIPDVTFFLHDEQALVNFKNRVLWAYEEFQREKKKKGGEEDEEEKGMQTNKR